MARQIKITGRAYPLFDIAHLILQKPERHQVAFSVKKNAEGQPVQPLFLCALDDTLWLSEDDAVAHVLRKHFATFYQTERTATEPPKGKYTFVAQCGMSGVVLGPPNYHDYQNQLRTLHAERFSRMPFEVYKSRVRIVRDADVARPALPRTLGLPEMPGLLDVLQDGSLDLSQVLVRTNVDKLSFLSSGLPHPRAAEMLASDAMSRLLREVSTRYDDRIVIFDSPPLLVTTEARALAARMGQVVFVVQSDHTLQADVERALATIEDCPVKMVVLNKASTPTAAAYGYGYGYGYGA